MWQLRCRLPTSYESAKRFMAVTYLRGHASLVLSDGESSARSPHGPRLATTGLATVTVLRPVVSSLSPETVDTVRCTAYFRCVAAS